MSTQTLLTILATLVLVTYREWGTDKAPSDLAAEQSREERTDDRSSASETSPDAHEGASPEEPAP